jgi:GDP-4-dehydro-6-deoxy-D-mannose reductase
VCSLVASVRPDVVVHLAGGKGARLYEQNVVCTRELMCALAAAAPRAHVIVAGSAAEYGPGVGLSENAAQRPGTAYGRAKAAQTEVARGLASRHGLSLTVARPFNVVAPQPPRGSPLGDLLGQLRAAGPRPELRCGRLELVRDYVDVRFVADVFACLAVSRPSVPVLNICSGTGATLGDILAELATRLGKRPTINADPELLADPAPPAVTGDPSLLCRTLGMSAAMDAGAVADALLRSPE